MFCAMFVSAGLWVGGNRFGVRYWGLVEGRIDVGGVYGMVCLVCDGGRGWVGAVFVVYVLPNERGGMGWVPFWGGVCGTVMDGVWKWEGSFIYTFISLSPFYKYLYKLVRGITT